MKKVLLILVAIIGFGTCANAQKAYSSTSELAQGFFQMMKNFSKTSKKEFVDNFFPVISELRTLQSNAKDFDVNRKDIEDIYDAIKTFSYEESVVWQDVTFVKYEIGDYPEKAANITFNKASIAVQNRGPEIGIGFSYYEFKGKYYLFFIRGIGYR